MTILELLETHNIAAFAGCDTLCACDRKWRTNIAWRAHVAEVLEAHQKAAKADAWDEGAWHGYTHAPLDYKKNPYRATQLKDKP